MQALGDRVSEVFLEVQHVSCGAGGKQWAIGIWRCRRQAACIWIEAQDSKKISCDDPFQTVPGSIPGSCIPAFTGTRTGAYGLDCGLWTGLWTGLYHCN